MSIGFPTQTAVTSGGVLYTGQSFCHSQPLTQTGIQTGSNIKFNGAFQNKTHDCKSAFWSQPLPGGARCASSHKSQSCLTKPLLTLGPSSCGSLLIWLYVVEGLRCLALCGGQRQVQLKTPVGEVQSQQSLWQLSYLNNAWGFVHWSKHKKFKRLLSLLGQCHANNLPSTEQAVKTKPKQDKSFSFIFRCFWPFTCCLSQMLFCGLITGISPKMCILCVRVKISKCSFEPFCVWIYCNCSCIVVFVPSLFLTQPLFTQNDSLLAELHPGLCFLCYCVTKQ